MHSMNPARRRIRVSEAQRIAQQTTGRNCSADTIRRWANLGYLPVAGRTPSGAREFWSDVVERVAIERLGVVDDEDAVSNPSTDADHPAHAVSA